MKKYETLLKIYKDYKPFDNELTTRINNSTYQINDHKKLPWTTNAFYHTKFEVLCGNATISRLYYELDYLTGKIKFNKRVLPVLSPVTISGFYTEVDTVLGSNSCTIDLDGDVTETVNPVNGISETVVENINTVTVSIDKYDFLNDYSKEVFNGRDAFLIQINRENELIQGWFSVNDISKKLVFELNYDIECFSWE